MSRSYRKTPMGGWCGSSDKVGKQLANRRYRSISKIKLNCNYEDESIILPVLKEVSNAWDFPKDGKMGWWSLGPDADDREKEWFRRFMGK